MYGKREEYFLLEWIQWCQDIEYLENVFNIDACLLLQRMRKDVYQGSSQKGKIPEEVNLAPKMTIKVLLIWSWLVNSYNLLYQFLLSCEFHHVYKLGFFFFAIILHFSSCCSLLLFQQSAIGRVFPIFVACKQPFTYIDPVIKCENVQIAQKKVTRYWNKFTWN